QAADHRDVGGPETGDAPDQARQIGRAEYFRKAEIGPIDQRQDLDLVPRGLCRPEHLRHQGAATGEDREPPAHSGISSPFSGSMSVPREGFWMKSMTSVTSGSPSKIFDASSTRSRSVPSLEKIMR